MEDDLEAQLVQQLAKVWRLHAEKEREAKQKAEHEAKEKAMREAKERAEREAQEKEWWDMEFWVKFAEEQRQRQEVVTQRVMEAKELQHHAWRPEASGSGRNGDSDVSSPSPSPVYMRLIWKQAAWVSGTETETESY